MGEEFKTIIEPFRIKVTEAITLTTKSERKKYLEEAGLNTFLIPSDRVLIDLLTDSGTGAMSSAQWAAMMMGDESYAGSPSFYRFEKSVRDITTHSEIIPTHQGRASERILFETLGKAGHWVVSNMLFDTTRANAENVGCKVQDFPCEELFEPQKSFPFKGNMNVKKLNEFLQNHSKETTCVVMTVTNNSGGGQPASLANIKEVAAICQRHQVTFVIDACRFAENAYFIKLREESEKNKTPLQIAQSFLSLADIITVSAKKDGMANIGGILTTKNKDLAQQFRNRLILSEGFPTYGGLAGRDLDAIAVGLWEALDESYLKYRLRTAEYMGERLTELGIPIVQPPGGHAIYIDAKRLLPHIPQSQYPGQAFVASYYEFAGIRSVEIGSVMFGKENPNGGAETPHIQELVRLAFPRRTYTQAHFDYIVETLEAYKNEIPKIRGVKFTYKPKVLRHFTARFEWV
ncbi:MAG: tryptophanase [Proteobacteria bacterium]|nr:tryptophanase [Pseudomonadota bacterium]